MGGRGTYAAGKKVPYRFETVGEVEGVKIIHPIDKRLVPKLPEESNTSTEYVLYYSNGVFHQYRKYDSNHEVVLEIGYHRESQLGKGWVLHVHVHHKPGVIYHDDAEKYVIGPGHPIYEKYKKLFKGVK